MFTKGLFLILIAVGVLSGCESKHEYKIHDYHSVNESDTLITNILTFVAKKPKYVDWQTRHDIKYRPYYVKQLQNYEMMYYHIAGDSTHYFYMLRPAKNLLEKNRGVGGRFKTKNKLQITEFEEVFNTPVLPRDSLIIIGKKLFSELITNGNIEAYLSDRKIVEWPDDRLKYDVSINDWVFIK